MKRESALVLASTSERRRKLLGAAGFDAVAIDPRVDDGGLSIRADHAQDDCCALAWFKGVQVWNDRMRWVNEVPAARVILSADTVCVLDGIVMGKPRDIDDARTMLRSVRDRTVTVVTGVCLIQAANRSRVMLADRADLSFGGYSQAQLTEHLEGGHWRGRAGGFNLEDLLASDWPLHCTGDRTTVMGLPMKLLTPLLRQMLGGAVVPT